MIERAPLVSALRDHLPSQRWYSGTEAPAEVRVVAEQVCREEPPWLVRLVVDADGALYQVPLGLVPVADVPEFLRGQESRILGEFASTRGPVLAYDAVVDPVLGAALLDRLIPGESAAHVRPVAAEQSNSSLVFDDRLIMKLFRRLHPGPNPDVEVTGALTGTGFPWVAPPLASERIDGDAGPLDLAVVAPFLAGGVEAWALALNSLRGLFADQDTQSVPVINVDAPPPPPEPAGAGGDFTADAHRLGETTAAMHLALADAFGRRPADTVELGDSVARAVSRALAQSVSQSAGDPASTAGAGPGDSGGPAVDREATDREDIDREATDREATDREDIDRGAVGRLLDRLGGVGDAGAATRIHGDLHLGQVMRTDAGWYLLDFEGEPARPLSERRRFWSPLRDVAGMCRSFSYAANVALQEQALPPPAGLVSAALDWERANRDAFVDGYRAVAGGTGLLPPSDADLDLVLNLFELERALYELAYEQAYRPAWVEVPLAGIHRLLEAV